MIYCPRCRKEVEFLVYEDDIVIVWEVSLDKDGVLVKEIRDEFQGEMSIMCSICAKLIKPFDDAEVVKLLKKKNRKFKLIKGYKTKKDTKIAGRPKKTVK